MPAHRPVLELSGTDLQRFHGPVHRVLRQLAGGIEAFAQPDNPRKRIHHPELTRPRRLGDQQAAIVGAQVKRGIKVIGLPAHALP
jgi:hypothetical protein